MTRTDNWVPPGFWISRETEHYIEFTSNGYAMFEILEEMLLHGLRFVQMGRLADNTYITCEKLKEVKDAVFQRH